MTENDIELAIKARLGNYPLVGFTYSWPNLNASGIKPYAEVTFVRVTRFDRTTGDGQTVSQGQLIVTLVTREGVGTTEANAAAQALASLFPKTLRIPAADGVIVITKPPDIREGFPDAGDWRTPVIVDYIAS